jgi:hypothetical protein
MTIFELGELQLIRERRGSYTGADVLDKAVVIREFLDRFPVLSDKLLDVGFFSDQDISHYYKKGICLNKQVKHRDQPTEEDDEVEDDD